MPKLLSLIVCLSALALMPIASANAAGPANPSANRSLRRVTISACHTAPAGVNCRNDALADINAAHASEGVALMKLPADYGTLTVPQQLLVLSDLERVARGLTPILGLSAPLDADAASAAARGTDPRPSAFYGNAAAANWEGGYASPLEADFEWMYDDGPGSPNADCTTPTATGCWGHRRDILFPFNGAVVMGAGTAPAANAPGFSELFVGGDRQAGAGEADAPLAPTWATIAASTPAGSSRTAPAAAPDTPTPGSARGTTPGSARGTTPGSTTTRGITAAIGPVLAPISVVAGQIAHIAGRFRSARVGRLAKLQALIGRQWRTVETSRLGSDGAYNFTLRAVARGTFPLRVLLPATRHAVAVANTARTLRVG